MVLHAATFGASEWTGLSGPLTPILFVSPVARPGRMRVVPSPCSGALCLDAGALPTGPLVEDCANIVVVATNTAVAPNSFAMRFMCSP